MSAYFKDKVVVVTGASKGIGKQMALLLLADGAKVAGIARSAELLNKLAEDAKSLPGQFFPVVGDIADPHSTARAMQAATDKFGVADILINNAGAGWAGQTLHIKPEDQVKCFDINFFGAVNCIQHVAPKMIERGSGAIVNVTSVAARYGMATYAFYSAAKAALAVYSQALRTELAPAGVDVLTVYPGGTDTDFKKEQFCAEGFAPDKIRSKLMSADYVAGKILKAITNRKSESVIGIPARIILFLKFLSVDLLNRMLVKEFKIERWYKKKANATPARLNHIDEKIRSGVSLLDLEKECQYHSNPEFITPSNLLPQGLAPSLYYVLYPYLLATAYGGNLDPGRAFANPVAKTKDPVFIRRKSLQFLDQTKNLVKTVLSPVMPLGRIKTLPEIETAGGSFPFDLGAEGTTCPAAIRSFFPFWAYSRQKGGSALEAWNISCPDHLKNLTFGTGSPSEDFYESVCYFGDKARIETKSPCNSCSCGAFEGQGNQKDSQTLEDIMKKLGFPCPTLLNVMYGYYLTLVSGGELAFYSKSFDAAIAQCPNPRSRVVVEIWRKQEKIEFKVLDVIGSDCPRGIKTNDLFSLPRIADKNGFCLDAFNSLFLSCGMAEFSEKPLNVDCVIQNCNASWEVSYIGGGV